MILMTLELEEEYYIIMIRVVIPHKNFKTYITYPLTNPVDVEIVSSAK